MIHDMIQFKKKHDSIELISKRQDFYKNLILHDFTIDFCADAEDSRGT